MRTRGATGRDAATSAASIAMEYGSSPVEQPALHTVSARPRATARRMSSGSSRRRSASICGGFRKKCVSGMVTSSSSRCRSSTPAGALTRAR